MSRSDRRPIHRLKPATVARIAAGEVVESTASVVKELVENAYDAGGSEVRVEIWGGGTERIRVSDNGSGILPEELALAVERHATSKLSDSEDLDTVATLGFRGEALASIGAVSHLSIRSRTALSDSAHGIRVDGGEVSGEYEEGGPPGTTVDVRDLFYNTPARRKFLRSPAAEQVEVTRVVGALYLARPGIALSLSSEGQEIARYPATGSLSDAVVRVLGEELLGQTLEVRADPLGEEGLAVTAVLARPTVSRGTSSALYLSVNGRIVASRTLQVAVRLAYEDYLPKNRFPLGTVHLVVDPSRLDVNVHPTKREVRIAREREVAEALRRAVRGSLQGTAAVSDPVSAAPRPYFPSVGTGGPRPTEPPRVALAGSLGGGSGGGATSQARLEPAAPPRAVDPSGGHPRLRLLGSLFHLYWVAESEASLVLIDQHAASERVVYDSLRADGRLARQELVSPVTLTLSARQSAAWAANREEIDAAGFEVESFGGSSFRVASTPVFRGRLARAETLPELLDELADGGRSSAPNDWVERRAASLACHAAVRGGDAISAEEMGRILEALYRLPGASYACPHGRPILVRLDRRRLDQWFLRSTP
ncbi:MAG: DNA mismatch repair endonuclease MutL [Thermoplasmata archaeon]|nr:DNA mismatch repair endonuclease MutL [Thermoplasmata archaeon]MCI4359878.1 DNA mismatch repair endonuclease MutL [Thermoplasmata archaeon]